jgi:hypothetical protein
MPDPAAPDAHWAAFVQKSFEDIRAAIVEIDRVHRADPLQRVKLLRDIRRQHHIVVIADRLRRLRTAAGEPLNFDLLSSAEYVIERPTRRGARVPVTRSPEDRKLAVLARVHWHKLIRAAGSEPIDMRGRRRGRRILPLNGSASQLRCLNRADIPEAEAIAILRRYIGQRLEQLIQVCELEISKKRSFNLGEIRSILNELRPIRARLQAQEDPE